MLPCLAWIPVCRLMGDTDWDYALQYYGHNILFAPSFYREHVVLYCVMYAFHAAFLGTAFAVLGLGLTAVIKNRYLALLLPFCYLSCGIFGSLPFQEGGDRVSGSPGRAAAAQFRNRRRAAHIAGSADSKYHCGMPGLLSCIP